MPNKLRSEICTTMKRVKINISAERTACDGWRRPKAAEDTERRRINKEMRRAKPFAYSTKSKTDNHYATRQINFVVSNVLSLSQE